MPKNKPVPEPTYAIALGLWNFTLSWVMQAQPSDEEALVAFNLFKRLAPAIVAETGRENLHHLSDIAHVQLGERSLAWLREARTTLSRLYPHFEDRLQYLIDRRGDFGKTWDKF